MNIFKTTDILLPKNLFLPEWSCNACDQFTSDINYWLETEKIVAGRPSSFRLMLPEIFLNDNVQNRYDSIYYHMNQYLKSGVFEEIKDSFIYVERKIKSGKIRRGLVGAIDLEAYDWGVGAQTPIRATEKTVAERLPARITIRERASLEMPHIMMFIDDPEDSIIRFDTSYKMVYDFDLIQGGGHITGWKVSGVPAAIITDKLNNLEKYEVLRKKYNDNCCSSPAIYSIGDGNHSLAAAKELWNKYKEDNPGCLDSVYRYALVELVNIHCDGVEFYPIHKVIFNTDSADFYNSFETFFSKIDGEYQKEVKLCANGKTKSTMVRTCDIGKLIDDCQLFSEFYCSEYGGYIDYIHDDENVLNYTSKNDCVGILLPEIDKSELFPYIMKNGVFPKKSFSVGHAEDKRYYLECRKI